MIKKDDSKYGSEYESGEDSNDFTRNAFHILVVDNNDDISLCQ